MRAVDLVVSVKSKLGLVSGSGRVESLARRMLVQSDARDGEMAAGGHGHGAAIV